jgi:hypothetical protein
MILRVLRQDKVTWFGGISLAYRDEDMANLWRCIKCG